MESSHRSPHSPPASAAFTYANKDTENDGAGIQDYWSTSYGPGFYPVKGLHRVRHPKSSGSNDSGRRGGRTHITGQIKSSKSRGAVWPHLLCFKSTLLYYIEVRSLFTKQ